jgi:hypothetical protein
VSGRRKTILKVSEIRKLSELQVTEREAAAFFSVHVKTFREMLRIDVAARAAWEDGREIGKIGLRRKQIALASTSAPVAIFLGKQWLGQADISVIEHSGRDGGPIKSLDLTKLDSGQRNQLRDVLKAARVKKE